MEILSAMFDLCQSSPDYVCLDKEPYTRLWERLREAVPTRFLELEDMLNAYASAATLEGFVNGYIWAQSTAQECLELCKRR